MSDDAYGATIAKLRLARKLTELRLEAGYTANHVCDMLNWGRGKVGRFEANQWKRPEMSDIRDLLRFYGVDDACARETEDLAMRARVRPWWRDYQDVFDNEFAGFEADATRIRVFTPLVIPGLLQTPDYIDALMRSSGKPPAWRRRATEARLRRQQILERDERIGSRLEAVIAEASLLYRWGSRSERREQLLYLAEIGERPHVRLHLQRFADGPPPGMFSAVQIFDYSSDQTSLVFTETDHGIQEVSDAEYVNSYIEAFDRAVDAALEPRDTAQYLKQLAERLE
ncbi:MAG TPA: helix-turn-helix transcriptional regulator [Streptosporangiaceae bacterium]|nr:helix-turn-helix transcriptional regulator [Streptosporangiaceae bacterium]